ncbi:MAG: TetR family transcriptional regulator [Caulobacteraceae bacterium]|nr:TetR family transcriptional regulator [Caulobacteraceae bacterium]
MEHPHRKLRPREPSDLEDEVEATREAATKAQVFAAAERLFALHGFQNVSVRDITAEAGVNLASVNYHFGSKDGLLFEIFRRRTGELNRERARMLHEAADRDGGAPPLREILRALFEPPLRWSDPRNERRISVQFIIRARSEGTEAMREVLRSDVSHLRRFADALLTARPGLAPEDVYWRLHFCLGMTHNNRFAEFERLHVLSQGLTSETDMEALLERMLDFAEAGFVA